MPAAPDARLFTFACEKGDDAPAPTPTPDVDRTVLVYLASDNNLYRFALQNLNDMKSAMEGLDGNLLVYIDEANRELPVCRRSRATRRSA